MSWIPEKIKLSKWDWVILLLASVPAFYLIGKPAIYIWDEAVYANASWDMAHGHSWLLPKHGTYNTKPPLVLWLQAISLTLFSSPEWAIRLPSALSVTGICVLLLIALKRWGFDQWTRLWVVVCFIGHEGFIRHHISRTGDLDAVMSFFTIMYSLVFLDALYFKKWNHRYLLSFLIAVVLAFYSKSIAGWLMLGPVLCVWLLSPLRYVLWTRKFVAASFLTLLVCGLYYLIREQLQPGYLGLVWHSEYLRIAKNIMTYHEHGFGYYFQNFISLKIYNPWIYFLLLATAYMLFISKKDERKNQYLAWIILAFGYMVTISLPPVKLEWYDAPVYPFFALILGATIGEFIHLLPSRTRYILLLPVLLIFWRKMDYIKHDTLPRHEFEYEGAMVRQLSDVQNLNVFMPVEYQEHRLQLDFYLKVAQQHYGIQIPIIDQLENIQTDTRLLLRKSPWMDSLNAWYNVDTLRLFGGLGYEVAIHKKVP